MKVTETFSNVLGWFSKCHVGYNGGALTDTDIDQLGKICDSGNNTVLFNVDESITHFMESYRRSFPRATTLPKMHILEDHVMPWVQRWRTGSGLMGEQGSESIHAHFHKLEDRNCGVVNPLDRLTYTVKQHNLDVLPQLRDLQPQAKKYKCSTSSSE